MLWGLSYRTAMTHRQIIVFPLISKLTVSFFLTFHRLRSVRSPYSITVDRFCISKFLVSYSSGTVAYVKPCFLFICKGRLKTASWFCPCTRTCALCRLYPNRCLYWSLSVLVTTGTYSPGWAPMNASTMCSFFMIKDHNGYSMYAYLILHNDIVLEYTSPPINIVDHHPSCSTIEHDFISSSSYTGLTASLGSWFFNWRPTLMWPTGWQCLS